MSYNTYNTRNSGRYNMPGRFMSGGDLAPGGAVSYGRSNRGHNNGMTIQFRNMPRHFPHQPLQLAPQSQQMPRMQVQTMQQPQTLPQPHLLPQPTPPQHMEQNPIMQNMNLNVDMKPDLDAMKEGNDIAKPYWMKPKLIGVKKITNKERRRRQNENLRRLLAPKNALMVLNEMLPGERDVAQFKVEPAAPHPYFNNSNVHSFCAELTLEGVTYKGYGDNKIAARNDAAEQAIRDLIIKRMAKARSVDVSAPAEGGASAEGDADAEGAAGAGAEDGAAEEDQALPMIQLASFALHKLFAEWECDGHKVPHLKTMHQSQSSEAGSETSAPPARRALPRMLPVGAATMHPCMLLTYMRPHLEYRELPAAGDRPQNMLFTMSIDVDGTTYVGKATNKREARRQAARSACMSLFGVEFMDGSEASNNPAPQ